MCVFQECSTWLNIAAAQEESGCLSQDIESSYSTAVRCAEASGGAKLQVSCSKELKAANSKSSTYSNWSWGGPELLVTWCVDDRLCGSCTVCAGWASLQSSIFFNFFISYVVSSPVFPSHTPCSMFCYVCLILVCAMLIDSWGAKQ